MYASRQHATSVNASLPFLHRPVFSAMARRALSAQPRRVRLAFPAVAAPLPRSVARMSLFENNFASWYAP